MNYRQSYIEVDLSKVEYNIKQFIKHSNKHFFAVIKANAYGLGAIKISKIAAQAGASYLAVSSLDEAIELRNANITLPILVLGYVNKDYVNVAVENNITLTATSLEFVKSIRNVKNLKIHLKINTGMNRLGLNGIEEVNEAMKYLKYADIEGIYTHYACSDEKNHELNQLQYNRFKKIVTSIDYKFKYIHISNTDGSIIFNDNLTNSIRVGLGMIGFSSYDLDLKPTIKLYSEVSNCHMIKKGESVSYGAEYIADNDHYVLTLPIGYADGWLRANEGRKVYINGEYGIIIGRICMDQLMVKVNKPYSIDSKVELFGDHINLIDVSKELNTIPYEVLTLLSDRLTKKYFYNDKLIDIKTSRFEH